MKLCVLCAIEFQDEDPSPYFRDWDAETHWFFFKANPFQRIRALVVFIAKRKCHSIAGG